MFKKVIIRWQSLALCKFVCAMDYFCNLFYLLSVGNRNNVCQSMMVYLVVSIHE